MSRGFDGFEIDAFRDSQWQSEPSCSSRESRRGRGSSSQTEAGVRIELAKLRIRGFLLGAQLNPSGKCGRSPIRYVFWLWVGQQPLPLLWRKRQAVDSTGSVTRSARARFPPTSVLSAFCGKFRVARLARRLHHQGGPVYQRNSPADCAVERSD
jgi:hypothetical protein